MEYKREENQGHSNTMNVIDHFARKCVIWRKGLHGNESELRTNREDIGEIKGTPRYSSS